MSQTFKSTARYVYRLMFRSDIETMKQTQRYERQQIDLADNYIHLSSFDQAIKTAELYFKGQPSLVMAQLQVADLEAYSESNSTSIDAASSTQSMLTWDWVEPRQAYMPHFHASHIPSSLIKSFIELTPNASNEHQVPQYLDQSVPQSNFVYKIADKADWNQSINQSSKKYCGNDKDRVDGFIHLSNIDQVSWVANKFKTSQSQPNQYVLLTIPIENLQSVDLVYEWSAKMRTDESINFPPMFAHYYNLDMGIHADWVSLVQSIPDLNDVMSLIQ